MEVEFARRTVAESPRVIKTRRAGREFASVRQRDRCPARRAQHAESGLQLPATDQHVDVVHRPQADLRIVVQREHHSLEHKRLDVGLAQQAQQRCQGAKTQLIPVPRFLVDTVVAHQRCVVNTRSAQIPNEQRKQPARFRIKRVDVRCVTPAFPGPHGRGAVGERGAEEQRLMR